jgi:hypothetical protein
MEMCMLAVEGMPRTACQISSIVYYAWHYRTHCHPVVRHKYTWELRSLVLGKSWPVHPPHGKSGATSDTAWAAIGPHQHVAAFMSVQ